MEVAVVGNATIGSRVAALLMAAGGFTRNEILNPLSSQDELPGISYRNLEEARQQKKARRALKHAMMKLYIERRRAEDGVRRKIGISEFQTLWARARSATN